VLINVNAGYGSSYQNNLQYVIADTEDLSYLKVRLIFSSDIVSVKASVCEKKQ
jgi:hypothetical protein